MRVNLKKKNSPKIKTVHLRYTKTKNSGTVKRFSQSYRYRNLKVSSGVIQAAEGHEFQFVGCLVANESVLATEFVRRESPDRATFSPQGHAGPNHFQKTIFPLFFLATLRVKNKKY